MKGKKWLLALVAVLCLMGTAWAGEREIVYNLGIEPRTIDPVLNSAVDGSTVLYNISEGLVRIGLDDAPEPGCAESWEVSEDGLSWTFHLREGLKWSDGKPLTAEDFRCGFQRVFNPENACPFAYVGYFIKNGEECFKGTAKLEELGVTAVDERTLRLDLKHPSPLMLDYLSYHIFFPARADVVEQDPRGWSASGSFPCNGPFMITEWKHNSELTVVKNPHYWDADKVKLDKVRMVMINDVNTALAAFKGGKVDYNTLVPAPMLPQLLESGEAKARNTLGTYFYVFNTARKPFDDVRVRKAFALAVDRTAIVEKVTRGGQKPANGFIPYGIPGVNPNDLTVDFRAEDKAEYLPERADVEQAKKLLAEAGYPDGKDFPKVQCKYNSNLGNKAIAEALQAMWRQNLGVEVELYNEEWKVFINTRNKKDFDIARHGYLVDFFDAGSLLEMWQTGVWENSASFSDAEYDALIRDSLEQMDRAKRIEDMHKAEQILMREMPVCPLYFYTTPSMQSARVKGIYHSPRNWVFFRGAEVVEP